MALSAMAGGVLLSGGEGKAVTQCHTFQPPITNAGPLNIPGPCLDGDWTVNDQKLTLNGTVQQNGLIDLTDNAVSPDQSQVDIDFDPITPTGTSGVYEYSIKTADHNIVRASLGATAGAIGSAFEVYKYIYSDSTFTTLVEELYVNQNVLSDLSAPFDLPQLWIKDTWTTTTTGIDNFINTYQTPGPLPILGASAAFGFSRRLRSRVKAAHSA
ncbi:MAG: hypothetical protein VKO39_00285 [Cyanobacteriota bacterium]|nr:hypothetical protein [Cyanobacteriota bacterium]